MHADEREITTDLVRRLVARQFPHWAGQPLTPVPSTGTVNAMFRLGDDKAVRLPRIQGGVEDIEREHTWLPRLAPHLPVPIPEVLGLGAPSPTDGYPWPWSVLRWLDGANPQPGALAAPELLARDLAAFVTALRAVDGTGNGNRSGNGSENRSESENRNGSGNGNGNGCPPAYRGGPLADLDQATRTALAELAELRAQGLVDVDTHAATAAWERALAAPAWQGPPVWTHSDLMPGNLLVNAEGRLSAVIDFGTMGVGDPAADLIPAWYLLPPAARETFRTTLRTTLAAGEALWERGRGWALSMALIQFPYYRETNPAFAADALHVMGEITGTARELNS